MAEVVIVALCGTVLLIYNMQYFLIGKKGIFRRHVSMWSVGVECRKEWAIRMMSGGEIGQDDSRVLAVGACLHECPELTPCSRD